MTKRNVKYCEKEHSPFVGEERIRADNDTAKRLFVEFNLNVKSYGYHYEGDFYGPPDEYECPIAFFDLQGYIIIESEHDLQSKMDIRERVHKYGGGISQMEEHIKYSHKPNSIIDYDQQVKDLEDKQEKKIKKSEDKQEKKIKKLKEEQEKKIKKSEEKQKKEEIYICTREEMLEIYAQKDKDVELERQKYINDK